MPQMSVDNLTNWTHRNEQMRCRTCMWFVLKTNGLGRCRRHAPTLGGWPVMFREDWCGDHKLSDNVDLSAPKIDTSARSLTD